MTAKLKIVFVLAEGGIAATGGFRIIAGYADRLQRRGHKITLLAPGGAQQKAANFYNRVTGLLTGATKQHPIGRPFLENSDVDIQIIEGTNTLAANDFPQTDIIVASWWETAEWVASASPNISSFHLIQGHEAFPYLPVDRVRAALRLPLRKIVVSQWLAEVMKTEYGVTNSILIENAVDADAFPSDDRRKGVAHTIGFVYSRTACKNTTLAIEVCKKIRRHAPETKFISFGSHAPLTGERFPKWISHRVKPGQQDLADSYRACDVWLFTSDEEGFGLPILEAMACGTPVVATPAGAAPQLVNDNNGALVKSDRDEIAAAAIRIVNFSPEQWKKMSDAAIETAEKHNWTQATDALEEAFYASVKKPAPTV